MTKLYNIYEVFAPMRKIFLFRIPKKNEKPTSRIWGIIFYLVSSIYLAYCLLEMETIGIVAEWSVIYFATAIYMRYIYAVSSIGIWNYHLFDYPKIVDLLKSIQEFHDRLKSDLNINVDLAKFKIGLAVGVVGSLLLCTLPFLLELQTTIVYHEELLWYFLTTGAFYYVFLYWNSLGSIFYACTLYIKASQISALTNINKKQFVLPKFERLYFKWFENFSKLVNSFGGIALLNLATIFVSATLGGYLVLHPTTLYNIDMLLYADVVALLMLILLIEAGKKVCDDAKSIHTEVFKAVWNKNNSEQDLSALKVLVLQMQHHNLNFTVCNLFVYDYRFLLLEFLLGVGNYLLILIQFQDVEN